MKIKALLFGICIVMTNCVRADDGADELLAKFLLKYDDFYNEFALRYRGEAYENVPFKGNRLERVMTMEGINLESKSRDIKYAAFAVREMESGKPPNTTEILEFKGSYRFKGYRAYAPGGNFMPREVSKDDEKPEGAPRLHPHGWALLPGSEFYADRSNFGKQVNLFLSTLRYEGTELLPDSTIRGAWRTPVGNYVAKLDFSKDEESMPVKAVWETFDEFDKGKQKSTNVIKWILFSKDLWVPKEIVSTSRIGEVKLEYRFSFEYLLPDRLNEKIVRIDEAFANWPGTLWLDEVNEWFDPPR